MFRFNKRSVIIKEKQQGDDAMNKKAAIIFVISLFIIQSITLLVLNIKYNYYSPLNYDDHLKYYFMIIIFYGTLNDALIFIVGFLIYYKKMILRSMTTLIVTGLLLLSIILVVGSGLYYAFTIDISLGNSNFLENISNFFNIFYIIYIASFTIFVAIIFKEKMFSDRLPKILLTVLFIIMIFVYLRQSTYYGFIHQWTNYDIRMNTSIRQAISYVILYPATIAAFIVSTLIIVKKQDKDECIEYKKEEA